MRPVEVPARVRLSDHLVLHLAREIVGGRLRPGDSAPPESELAAALNISKPVVRESIQALVGLGLIRVQQGKRTQVLPPHEWNVLAPVVQQAFVVEGRADSLTAQFYEVRLPLESQAAAWAAERANEQELAEIESLARRLDDLARAEDLDAFLSADRELHTAIAEAAGNDVLLGVLRNLQSFLARAWTDSRVRPRHLQELAEQHNAVARSILGRRPRDAARAMERHLNWAMRLETSKDGNRPRQLRDRPVRAEG